MTPPIFFEIVEFSAENFRIIAVGKDKDLCFIGRSLNLPS